MHQAQASRRLQHLPDPASDPAPRAWICEQKMQHLTRTTNRAFQANGEHARALQECSTTGHVTTTKFVARCSVYPSSPSPWPGHKDTPAIMTSSLHSTLVGISRCGEALERRPCDPTWLSGFDLASPRSSEFTPNHTLFGTRQVSPIPSLARQVSK